MEENKKKRNSNNILIVGLICILLAVAGYFIYDHFNNSESRKTPKQRFTASVEKMFNEKANISNTDFETLKATLSLKAKLDSPFIDSSITDIINKLDIKGGLDIDAKEESIRINLDAKYDKDNVIKLDGIVKDNSVYVFFDGIYDKWLKEEGTTSDEFKLDFSGINQLGTVVNDLNEIIDELENGLINSLDDSYFETEKVDDLTKITLTVDEEKAYEIADKLIEELKNSKKAKKAYEDLTESDFTKDIDETQKQIKQAKGTTSLNGIKVTISSYVNKKNEAEKLVIAFENEGQDLTIELVNKDENTIDFTIKNESVPIITGSLKTEEKNGTTNFTLTVSMMGMINLELNGSYSIEINTKLDKPNLNNSISFDDLTEAEKKSIEEKIENSKGLVKLLEDIKKIDLEDMDLGLDLDY